MNKPTRLYKYLCPDRIDVLEGMKIRYSQPGALNDLFECRPYITEMGNPDEINSIFMNKMKSAGVDAWAQLPDYFKKYIPPELIQNYADTIRDDIYNQFHEALSSFTPHIRNMMPAKLNELQGMLCLSTDHSNVQMWAHYASNHTGYLIGFDATHQYFWSRRSETDEFYYLRQVEYRTDRPNHVMTDLDGVELFLVKAIPWSHECEWRIFKPLKDSNAVIDQDSFPIHLYSFPAECICEVIVGCRMGESDRSKLLQVVHQNQELQHVNILQAKPSESEYALEFDSVV